MAAGTKDPGCLTLTAWLGPTRHPFSLSCNAAKSKEKGVCAANRKGDCRHGARRSYGGRPRVGQEETQGLAITTNGRGEALCAETRGAPGGAAPGRSAQDPASPRAPWANHSECGRGTHHIRPTRVRTRAPGPGEQAPPGSGEEKGPGAEGGQFGEEPRV